MENTKEAHVAKKKMLFWNLRKTGIFTIWKEGVKQQGNSRVYVFMTCTKFTHLPFSLKQEVGSRNQKIAFEYFTLTVALDDL